MQDLQLRHAIMNLISSNKLPLLTGNIEILSLEAAIRALFNFPGYRTY